MNKATNMTQGSVQKIIRRMMVTLVIGAIAAVVFGFVDTALVGRLGETQLAVLGFAAPVTMIVLAIVLSLCLGVGTAVARASTDKAGVKHLTTDGLMITMGITFVIVIAGLLSIKPLFFGMGATQAEMPYIIPYMTVWFLGLPAIAFSMVGTNVMRGIGNAKVTALMSTIMFCICLLLDPFLILGLWIFPELGILGAAVSIMVGRISVLLFMLYVMVIKAKLVSFKGCSICRIKNSAKKILHVAVPSMITKSIIPIGAYIITGFLAAYGSNVVAGFGAGGRVGNLALVVTNSLAAVMVPFAGQNFGAGKLDRLRHGFRYSLITNAVYGIAMYLVLFFAAPYIAELFSTGDTVRQSTVLYLRIAMGGLVFQGGALIITSMFNAVGKPIHAAGISIMQVFVLYVPVAYMLSQQMGPAGIFVALVASYVVAFAVSYRLFQRFLSRCENEQSIAVRKRRRARQIG